VPFWVSRSPEDFVQLLRARKVTVLNQTPSAFGQLSSLPQAYQDRLSLRVVIFGGEALDPQRLRQWIAHHGDDSPQLINMYGITETTVHVTCRRITAADLERQRSPVGQAIPDLGLRVLDAQLNLVPVGVPGELHVSGAGLSRGYLHRAGLTSERFVAAANAERLYRTGDLVRWDADGQLAYLGRIDHQVKVRGFRIELGEIEAQLLAQPEVREAVVLADEGPAGTRLVAYVSAQAGHVVDVAQLMARLGEALPDYMVPAAVVVLDALPLNANGKVNRQGAAGGGVHERGRTRRRGRDEQKLAARSGPTCWAWSAWAATTTSSSWAAIRCWRCGCWSACAPRAGGAGAHAVPAAAARRLRAGAGADAGTGAGRGGRSGQWHSGGAAGRSRRTCSRWSLDARQIARIEAAVPGGAANIQDIYPLVAMQEGMLFHHLLHAEGDAYVTLHSLSFDSREAAGALRRRLQQVIARHDILRTAVLWEELPEPVQVVQRSAVLALQWWCADAAPWPALPHRRAQGADDAAVAAHDAAGPLAAAAVPAITWCWTTRRWSCWSRRSR
jgi:hypothetical protein